MNFFLSNRLHKIRIIVTHSQNFQYLYFTFIFKKIRYLYSNEVDEVVAVNEEGVDYVDYKYQVVDLEGLQENIVHAFLEEMILNFLGITNESVDRRNVSDDQIIGDLYEEVNLVGSSEEDCGIQVNGQNLDDHLSYLGPLQSPSRIRLHIEEGSFVSLFVFDYKTKLVQPLFLYLNCQLNWKFLEMPVFGF